MAGDWCEFRPPVIYSPFSCTAGLNSGAQSELTVVFFCPCHLAWASTLVTPDRFLPYLDVKTTRLYPLVSVKFLLIPWQLRASIKTNSDLKLGSLPGSLSFLIFWTADLPVSPFHLPPTSPSRSSSLLLLGTLTLSSIFNEPFLDIWSLMLCVGGVRAGLWKLKKVNDTRTDKCVLALCTLACIC